MFQQKVLCIGNNDYDTDQQTSKLATDNHTVNHGLIAQVNFVPKESGYYHTTVIDMAVGDIFTLAKYFDLIVLLDQPLSQWSNWKLLNTSYKLVRDLEKQGVATQYRQNKNIQVLIFFDSELKENKSFCIHPWINFTEEDRGLKLCPRDSGQVLPLSRMEDWKNNPQVIDIQKNMLAGNKLPERCKICYGYEDIGAESYRQYETLEWLLSLGIKTFDDLNKITQPYMYELRLSNKCNIMCRSCNPLFSHLIDKEAKQHHILYPIKDTIDYSKIDRIDIGKLQSNSRVYLTGGEPTIMPDVIEFMRRCIAQSRTDFELTFGTNGVKFSPTFLNLCQQFSKLNFSFSLDGYGKINDYWRWGSDWDTIVKNMHTVQDQGHNVSINTVPGIYNVTNLHLLFEWLDVEFPMTSIYLQFNYFVAQSVFNHPNHALVLDSMQRCKNTNVYLADGKSTKTGIDSIYHHYSQSPTCDLERLREFFKFNDKLDLARNSRLGDYIPELEECRKLL